MIADGHVARGVEQMLPSAIGNALKSTRYASEGTNTLRGDPITGEVSAWNVGAQFFGFAPAEYTRQLELNAMGKRIDRAANEERTNLLREYYVTLKAGDGEGLVEVMERMGEFSAKHPSAAITASTIKRSIAQHFKTSSEMYHGVQFSRNMRNEVLTKLYEYEEEYEGDEY